MDQLLSSNLCGDSIAAQLLDNIDAWIYIIDPDTCEILYVNRKLSGNYPDESLIGKTCWQEFRTNQSAPCESCRKLDDSSTSAAGSDPCTNANANMNATDRDAENTDNVWEYLDIRLGCHCRSTASRITWHNGLNARMIYTIDVTAEYELSDQSSKAKNDFLSRMSHEIRTPINTIVGMSHIANSTNDLFKMKSCLTKIDIASKQLIGIINDVLDMSTLEAGLLKINRDIIQLERMLIEVCNLIIEKSEEKVQDLQVVIERDVPAFIYGDEYRLSQILINLLTNAIKFTDKSGKIRLQVSIQYQKIGKAGLLFSVIDNGIGIAAEALPKIFEPFEQINGTQSRKYGGTGLGLSICKHLVELMSGEINVKSTLGAGSTFTVKLEVDVFEKQGYYPLVLKHDIPLKTLPRILFVDDNQDLLDYFTYLTQEYRIPIDLAGSGPDALERVGQAVENGHPYNIIFMDLQMPELDGIETSRRIHTTYGEYPIVLLTSSVIWPRVEQEAAEAGIFRFVSKPLFPSSVFRMIDDLVVHAREKSSGGQPDNIPDFSSKRILLAENININRDIIHRYLAGTGVVVEDTVNGMEALYKFKANPAAYDLILMDLQMPEMDGYESTKQIRGLDIREADTVPIIAMTTDFFQKDIQRCLDSGMNGHIQKPVNRSSLHEVLSDHLNRSSNKRQSALSNTGSGERKRDPRKYSRGYLPLSNVSVKTKTGIQPVLQEKNEFSSFLPYFDVTDSLEKLHNNLKLYVTMLQSLKKNKICENFLEAVNAGNPVKIQTTLQILKGVSRNLSMHALLGVISICEVLIKHGQLPEDLVEQINNVVKNTLENLDKLLIEFDGEALR